jgi:universal stress protein A
VYLLHVVEPTTLVGDFGTVPVGAVQRDIPGKAKAALLALAAAEFPDSIPVHAIVRKGTAYDQISATARVIRADLIIIATHGYTGLKHVVLGSTAERVARHAPCPVLVLRRRPKA